MVDDTFSRSIDEEAAGSRDGSLLPPDAPADRVLARRFLRAAGRVRIEPLPAAVRSAIDARFEAWRVGRTPHGLGARIVAALTHEVLPGTVVAGARGLTAARHLVFSSDVADISVHVGDERGVGAIDGMVLRSDGLDATDEVRLVGEVTVVASTHTDLVGSFRFDAVPAGRYTLAVSVGDTEVETAPFDVSAGTG